MTIQCFFIDPILLHQLGKKTLLKRIFNNMAVFNNLTKRTGLKLYNSYKTDEDGDALVETLVDPYCRKLVQMSCVVSISLTSRQWKKDDSFTVMFLVSILVTGSFGCLPSQHSLAQSLHKAVSQFRVCILGSTHFDVIDVIARCKVCLNSLNIEAYFNCNLKMRPCFHSISSLHCS